MYRYGTSRIYLKKQLDLKHKTLWRYIMKYLLLVAYLFSATSFAGHCNAGASHDDDHDHDSEASHSEMKKESKVKKDSDSEEVEAKKDKESEA